jgi:hypothetical protein
MEGGGGACERGLAAQRLCSPPQGAGALPGVPPNRAAAPPPLQAIADTGTSLLVGPPEVVDEINAVRHRNLAMLPPASPACFVTTGNAHGGQQILCAPCLPSLHGLIASVLAAACSARFPPYHRLPPPAGHRS